MDGPARRAGVRSRVPCLAVRLVRPVPAPVGSRGVAAIRGFFFLLAVPFFLSGCAMAIPFAFLDLGPARSTRRPSRGRRPALSSRSRSSCSRRPGDSCDSSRARVVACAFVCRTGRGIAKGPRGGDVRCPLPHGPPAADLKLSPYKDLAAVRNLPGRGRSHPGSGYREITGRFLPRASTARQG